MSYQEQTQQMFEPNIHGQRIVVTGGAGFIGSNVANHLADRNTVIAVDDCSLGVPRNLDDDVRLIDADVVDCSLPDCDILIHLAALSSRNMHEDDPQRGCRVNVEGFVNAMEEVRDSVEAVVYASTSSIYGSRTEPTAEFSNARARTAYEASKMAREQYAQYYSNHYDLPMAGLRFFSVYQGFGGNEGHKGQFANTVAQFAKQIANDERPQLFGDGTQTRDFTHVDDVVRAIELAAENQLSGVFNVGTGERYSFNEMVEMINDVLETDVEPEYIECPFDDYVHDTLADAAKLRMKTGWEPEVDFEDGVRRVCEPYLSVQEVMPSAD